eukprot:1024348-Prymnesium_polylepis.1
MFGTEATGYTAVSWSPRMGIYQALRELNNKTDGVADHLLPSVQLRFAYRDSKCDAITRLTGALQLVSDAFGGEGVRLLGGIGAGCSCWCSLSGADHLAVVNEPHAERRPGALFHFTSVALTHSKDAYGAGGWAAFAEAAHLAGPAVQITESFPKDASDFSAQQRALKQSGARVIVLYCQASDGSRFLRMALEVDAGLWEADALLASDEALRERVLKGLFSIKPDGQPQHSQAYQEYLARRQHLPSPVGDGTSCNREADDDGNYLWAQDHDNNASTPLACADYDLSQDSSFDAFAYDAVFAIAYALHDLLEVQNRTEVAGSELLEVLMKRVAFEGLTGLVDVHDASAEPKGQYHGDRRVGFSYVLLNYVHNVQGLVQVGMWTPCSSSGGSCSWSERWQPTSRPLTYSTADNSRPVQTSTRSCGYGEVLDEGGSCVCDDGFEPDSGSRVWCRPCESGQDSRRPTVNTSGLAGCTMCAVG